MKRRGFTYINALFSAAVLAVSCVVLVKTVSLAHDTVQAADTKKQLAALNFSTIEQIEERLKSGEQIELNNYSTNKTKVTITADESSAAFLVTAKSAKNGMSLEKPAVLWGTE